MWTAPIDEYNYDDAIFDSDSDDKDADDSNKGGAVPNPGRRRLLGRPPCSKVYIPIS